MCSDSYWPIPGLGHDKSQAAVDSTPSLNGLLQSPACKQRLCKTVLCSFRIRTSHAQNCLPVQAHMDLASKPQKKQFSAFGSASTNNVMQLLSKLAWKPTPKPMYHECPTPSKLHANCNCSEAFDLPGLPQAARPTRCPHAAGKGVLEPTEVWTGKPLVRRAAPANNKPTPSLGEGFTLSQIKVCMCRGCTLGPRLVKPPTKESRRSFTCIDSNSCSGNGQDVATAKKHPALSMTAPAIFGT